MSQIETQKIFVPPVDSKAALFFLEGHYQFNYLEGSVEKTKFLSPAQIGKAFAVKDVFDSGWLETNVIRFALGAKKKHQILSVLPAGRRKIFITDPRAPPSNAKQMAKTLPPIRFSNSKFRSRLFCFWDAGKNIICGRRSTKLLANNQKSVPHRFRI